MQLGEAPFTGVRFWAQRLSAVGLQIVNYWAWAKDRIHIEEHEEISDNAGVSRKASNISYAQREIYTKEQECTP